MAECALLVVALLESVRADRGPGAFILIACCSMIFHINCLDKSVAGDKTSQFWIDFLESISLGFLAAGSAFYLFPALVPGLGMAVGSALSIVLLPLSLRLFLRHMAAQGRCVEEVLIVGTDDLPGKLHRDLGAAMGHVKRHPHVLLWNATDREPIDIAELKDVIVRERISRVVIAESDAQSRERLAIALLDARLRGLKVTDAIDFYEECTGKIWVEALNPLWFVYTTGFKRNPAAMCRERLFDLMFALILLVFSAPLLLLIAIAIKLDSKGPVFYRQTRVGLHGRTFLMYKFRSMRQDAEREGAPVWASEWDDRVTRIGRFLRNFRLDELPQALNVLKGEMSMVGPRPERPCFVGQLGQTIPYYHLRHYLKPGITGWAQVMYQYGASFEESYEKLQYDFYYAKHKSLCSDAAIMLKTVRIVLFGKGR